MKHFYRNTIRWLSNLESGWSLSILLAAAAGSFALPAWAVSAMDIFQEYAPASWVAAGFAGAFVFMLIYLGVALAKKPP